MKGRIYERKGFWVKDLLVTRLYQSLQENITWMKYCFRKIYLAAVSNRWEVGRLKAGEWVRWLCKSRHKVPKANSVSQDEERVDSGNEGRIKLRLSSKSESLTRSLMVPIRELDASGRLFVFLNQWCTLSIHIKFKVTVAISGRQTEHRCTHTYTFALAPTANCWQLTPFTWPSRLSVTQPLLSLQTSLFLFIYCNQIALVTLSTMDIYGLPSVFIHINLFVFTAVIRYLQ